MNLIFNTNFNRLVFISISLLQVAIIKSSQTTEIVKKVANSVVLIKASSKKDGLAQGSGVLISDGRTIITNLHVVQNASKVMIEFPDGTTLRSNGYLAVNPDKDLITIRLPKKIKNITPVKIQKLNDLSVGEKVVAIGSPRGLSTTVSEGIISAIREVDAATRLIQTTAPISPGSSGGGLFNQDAKLIGITTFLHVGGQNLNFAYPADDILPLLQSKKSIPFYDLQTRDMRIDRGLKVYVTQSGKKYHDSECRYLRKTKILMELSSAVNQGYLPCSICIL